MAARLHGVRVPWRLDLLRACGMQYGCTMFGVFGVENQHYDGTPKAHHMQQL